MARIIARNASIYLEDSSSASRAFSGFTNTVSLGQSAEAPEVTSFGEGTRARLSDGLKDWELSFDSFLSTGANEADVVLSGIVAGSTVFKLGPSGSSSGCILYTACGILTSYEMELGVEDAGTVSGTVVARTGSLTRTTWT